jgi:hypothetical protein
MPTLLCVWCLRPEDDPIHQPGPSPHAFVGPRTPLTTRQLVQAIAGELRKIARESIGPDGTASDALDLL